MVRTKAIWTLCLAGLIVAIAIATDGAVSRFFNGVGGLLWIGSCAVLLRGLREHARFGSLVAISTALTTTLVLFSRPSDYLRAVIGFFIAGLLIAFVAQSSERSWAALIPALWLPVHLGVAIGRVVERSVRDLPASVRTDPPPTSAFVPFAMVVAAILGGVAMDMWRRRKVEQRRFTQSGPSKAPSN